MSWIVSSKWMAAGWLGLATIGFAGGCGATQRTSQTHVATVEHAPAATPHAAHAAPVGQPLTPRDAWRRLQAGNARFVDNRLEHPDSSPMRRHEVAKGQHPFAIVLTCSDSRVPPEILFDTGLGDIFVIRVAGNTADDAAIGSMEYAVEHVGVPLIVVLGHERCGAVQAAVQAVERREAAPGHLGAIIDPIMPAATATQGQGGDAVENAVRENTLRVVRQLKECKPILAEAIHEKKLVVIGARYDLDSGQVTVAEPPATTGAAGH